MSGFDGLKLEILHAIYNDAFRPGSLSAFLIGDLKKVLPSEMVLGITQSILDELCNDDYLYRDSDGYYSISRDAVRYIEFLFGEDTSQNNGEREATESGPDDDIVVPAADRVVRLNHNSDAYKHAVKALDEAVAAFKADNSLGNRWGQEKGVLLRAIEAGCELLTESTVHVATIYTTIVEPLRIIRKRYEDAIVAGLVTAGADQVICLIERAASCLRALFG